MGKGFRSDTSLSSPRGYFSGWSTLCRSVIGFIAVLVVLVGANPAIANEGLEAPLHTEAEIEALRHNTQAPRETLSEVSKVSNLPAPTSESVPPAGAEGRDGLNAGEKVPPWAGHRFVHFFRPAVSQSSLGALPMVSGGPGETLKYWGGPVQHEPQLDLLFWGNNFWEKETSPVGLGAELEFFFYGMEKESLVNPAWQGILSQYWSNTAGPNVHAKVAREATVTAIGAPKSVTDEMVRSEINLWIGNGATFNSNSQFVVMLAPATTYSELTGCGYHSVGEYGGKEYVYTVIPYSGDANKYYKGNGSCNRVTWKSKAGETQQLMWSTTGAASHEFAESVTDPLLYLGSPYTGRRAWSSTSEGDTEIADLCIDREEEGLEHAIEELPEKNGRVGETYVNKLWDDGGGNTCKLENPPYSEPPPPTVTTEAVSGLAYRQATLNGSVNPNGPATQYQFEYGTTVSYGQTTGEGSIGAGTTTVGESATITSLKPGTTYHDRIKASNWAGTSYGTDKEFTTPIPPPSVTTEAATAIGESRATLNAVVNPEGFSTTYQFEYWPKGKGNEVTRIPATAESVGSGVNKVAVQQTPATLASNAEYVYRVVATNSGGTSHGNEAKFTTGPFLENHSTPNPSGAEESVLKGVSCTFFFVVCGGGFL